MNTYVGKLEFKHSKDFLHFTEGRLDIRLRALCLAVSEYALDLRRIDKALPLLVVTSTIRTFQDMFEIYAPLLRAQGIPEDGLKSEVAKRKSPHLENRAVDFRARDWTFETMGKIKDFIETNFKHYGAAVNIHDTGADLTNGKILTSTHYHVSIKPLAKGTK